MLLKSIDIGSDNSTAKVLTILMGMSHPTELFGFLAFCIAWYTSNSDKKGISVEEDLARKF